MVAQNEDKPAKRLKQVFQIFRECGLKLKREKCQFAVENVEFLGFQISKNGIQPLAEKVEAIKKSPAPQNKKELQSFLGLLNFYHTFLEKKSTIAEPLHRLLDKNSKWRWETEHMGSFNKLKKIISSDKILTHYSLTKPLGLVCDASPYGLGSVLFPISKFLGVRIQN